MHSTKFSTFCAKVLEIGWLDMARLPEGSGLLSATGNEESAVGLWRPETGQLLRVPPEILITVRNLSLQ